MKYEEKDIPLYETWLNNHGEEDEIFVFDNGLICVFFERKLHLGDETLDPTISLFTFKGKYRKQTTLICNHLNYFVKYYDPDKRYLVALLKMKILLDTKEGGFSKESFIKQLYETIITDEIVGEVSKLVEKNNIRSIEDAKKTEKYGKASSFDDRHNAILYRMSMCTNLMIPLILHYVHRFTDTIKMFLINEFYDPLFEICGQGVNLKEKLFNFILDAVRDSQKRDATTWEQKALLGDFDPITFAEQRLQNIVSNIIPKLDYKESDHNIALIRSTVSSDFINFTRERYALFPTEISDERDNDDSLSQQDKIEMTILRKDLSNIVISTVNKDTVINNIKKEFKVVVSKEELDFYKKMYHPTDFQMSMIQLFFAKYFNGFSEMESLSADQLTTLAIILKYRLQTRGCKYLQLLIVGDMRDRISIKALRSVKFIEKIEKTNHYKRLVEKYAKLLKLKGDKLILDQLSILLKTRFTYIDFNHQDLLDKEIEINEDIVCEEFLEFLNQI